MKIKLTISTEDGRSYEGEMQLSPVGGTSRKSATPKKTTKATASSAKLDFTLPLRAFVTANNARKLGGKEKFTLLLAGMAKGDTHVEVDLKRIIKEWGKMTGPMDGSFNGAHATRATEKGWVESVKQGVYKLRSTWQEAISP
jgi:hypothetical protein